MKYELFLDTLEIQQKKVIEYLHNLFLSFPQVHSRMRYKIPFFGRHNWICYLNPRKNDTEELCFIKAREMDDPRGVLDFRTRVDIAGLTLTSIHSIQEDIIIELFNEALMVDEEIARSKKSRRR